jgi:hypothetical protein
MVKSGLAVRRAQRKGTKREVPREGAREEGYGSTRVTGRARESRWWGASEQLQVLFRVTRLYQRRQDASWRIFLGGETGGTDSSRCGG